MSPPRRPLPSTPARKNPGCTPGSSQRDSHGQEQDFNIEEAIRAAPSESADLDLFLEFDGRVNSTQQGDDAFVSEVQRDVAESVGLHPSNVKILDVRAGCTVVEMRVTGDADRSALDLARSLQRQAWDVSSVLRRGKQTSHATDLVIRRVVDSQGSTKYLILEVIQQVAWKRVDTWHALLPWDQRQRFLRVRECGIGAQQCY